MMVLPVVVLPQPDSPTNPNVSPSYNLKETLSTAFINGFLVNPSLVLKYFFTSTISNSGFNP